jgi:hypothetical protein
MARFSINVPVQPGIDDTFRSKDGPVGRDLSDRATRVQLAAKAQVGVARPLLPGDNPAHRPIPGRLKQDITKNWLDTGNPDDLAISVGSSLPYALMHHEGTRPHAILPRNKSVLRWVGADGRVHFARAVSHPGTKPNRYLTDNLHLAGG